MKSKMWIYDQSRAVPSEAMKNIAAGRLKGMTDINPMWRIKKLTELFGPCGIGWWYEITDKHIVEDELTKQKAAFVDILLFYKDPDTGENSHGVPGTGGASFVAQERNGPYLSDECYKMALTDAISVAAKALGVGANVYWDKDKSKYGKDTEEYDAPHDAPKPLDERFQGNSLKFTCADCGKELEPIPDSNGKPIPIRSHAAKSEKMFGRVLCLDCIRKLNSENANR